MVLIWKMDTGLVIFFFFFFVIFIKIHGLCISFLLDWFELQREAFMLWHEEESEQIENMEKNCLERVNKQ